MKIRLFLAGLGGGLGDLSGTTLALLNGLNNTDSHSLAPVGRKRVSKSHKKAIKSRGKREGKVEVGDRD